VQSDCFAQAPLHAISYYRSTQHLAHRESNPGASIFLALQIEDGHVWSKMPPSLFIHSLEIRMPKQTRAAWELTAPAGIGCLIAALRNECAHHSRPNPGWEAFIPSGPGEPLLTEAGFYRHPLAALGAPARYDRAAALGLHSRAKAVRLRAVTTVGLEGALRHEKSLLLMN
jgi:hypothetical protein